jgi:hypothetical protein
MPRNLLQKAGQIGVDNLVRDNLIFQNRIEVRLPAGNVYPRGQALVLADDGVTVSIPTGETEILDAVLLDDIGDLSEEPEDVMAAASLTGAFNQNVMHFGEIDDADLPAVLKRTRSERQLDIAPMHQAPFVEWGKVE